MKYLVTFRRRDGLPIPPDAIAEMLLAQRDWVQARIDDGVLDCGYIFAQGGGGVGIVNANSGEELSEIINSSPGAMIANIELQPLADVAGIGNAANALQRIGATV